MLPDLWTTELPIPTLSPEGSGIFLMDHVFSRVPRSFQFGYHTYDDMKQEAYIICIEFFNRAHRCYDHTRPIEKILYVNLINRLLNLKRDQFRRVSPPCKTCPFHIKRQCTAFDDRMECEKYAMWEKRNVSRQNLMNFAPSEAMEPKPSPCKGVEMIEYNDTFAYLSEIMPQELRSDYLRMLDGVAVSSDRREQIRAVVTEALGDPDAII
jgi:hypothetical protein